MLSNDQFATVWGEPQSISPAMTKIRISTSSKDSDGVYRTDFSDYVTVIGKEAAPAAMKLRERDRIRLGRVGVTTNYNKDTKVKYVNCCIFGFQLASFNGNGGGGHGGYQPRDFSGTRQNGSANYSSKQRYSDPVPKESFVEEDIDLSNDDLPF